MQFSKNLEDNLEHLKQTLSLEKNFDVVYRVVSIGGKKGFGSSVEFDWCSVNAVQTARKLGYKSIITPESIRALSPIQTLLPITTDRKSTRLNSSHP